MTSPLKHVAAFAHWALHRGRETRADLEALSAFLWSPAGDLPRGLELRWLGTAGYALSYEGFDLLIDPYLTRIPVSDLIRRRTTGPDTDTIARYVPNASAVLIGHTHFDHVLDAPAIVREHGCDVYGSKSVETLMGLYGMPERARVVEPYQTFEVGPFEITFVPSAHSKLALGLWVPYSGPITCEHLDSLSPSAYNCDQVYGIHIRVAGVTFYHQGSADLIDDAIRHHDIDYFLCGIAGRQFTDDYVARILHKLQPRVVVPGHYDNFFRPLAEEMDLTADVGVARFTDEVAAVSKQIEIRSLPVAEPSAV